MHTAYIIVTILAVVANAAIALADVTRAEFVVANSRSVGVPESWLVPLGLVKAAGAAGLLLGLLGVPLIGTVAAAGLVLFFVGAVLTHLRARSYALGFPGGFLALAVGAFLLSLG